MSDEEPVSEAIQHIAEECREAGASPWATGKIVKELRSIPNARREALRRHALELLSQFDPKAAKTFESFQKLTVRTSALSIQRFDRGNIIQSLLKETSISRPMAEKIGFEVEDKIKDIDIQVLSTALIREMVIGRLLEYGLENIRHEYCRVGLPVFDVEARLASNAIEASSMLVDFHLAKVIAPKLVQYHLQQEIHISGLAFFSARPVAVSTIVSVDDNAPLSARVVRGILSASRQSAWAPTIEGACHATTSASRKERNNQANVFWSLLSSMKSLQTMPGVVQWSVFSPTRWKSRGVDRKRAIENLASHLDAYEKQAEPAAYSASLAMDSKYQAKFVEKIPFELDILHCAQNDFVMHAFAIGGGVLAGHYALRLPALTGDNVSETRFLERVQKRLDVIEELENLRRKQLERRAYLAELDIPNAKSSVTLAGLYESQKLLYPESGNKELFLASEKLCREIRKRLDSATWHAEISDELPPDAAPVNKNPVDMPFIPRVIQTTTASNKKELVQKMETGFERIRFLPQGKNEDHA